MNLIDLENECNNIQNHLYIDLTQEKENDKGIFFFFGFTDISRFQISVVFTRPPFIGLKF